MGYQTHVVFPIASSLGMDNFRLTLVNFLLAGAHMCASADRKFPKDKTSIYPEVQFTSRSSTVQSTVNNLLVDYY